MKHERHDNGFYKDKRTWFRWVASAILIIVTIAFLIMLFSGCKTGFHVHKGRSCEDVAMWGKYHELNDTLISTLMAIELYRLEREAIATTFQCIEIEKKDGYNVAKFQFMYDGNFLGGSIEMYLHSDSLPIFDHAKIYNIFFAPFNGGTPPHAPKD